MILYPYIKTRREATGEWFATPLIRFTLRSLRYVLQFKHGLHLGHEGEKGLDITVGELEAMKEELEEILRKTPCTAR